MFLCTRRSEAEALFLRAETVRGLGGRRGFYSRPSGMSTTFSDKKRFFQQSEKPLIFQRVLCQPKRSTLSAPTFCDRNDLNLSIPLTGFKLGLGFRPQCIATFR
jgi:hypothetical protein